jgi:hypothetical protein
MNQIIRQSTVIRDGYHNAFTDLQYWQSLYWVSYRKGSGHISMDGEVIVSVSSDRSRFREIARVKLYGDNRDPKLFPISKDRIAMTIPTWEGNYESKSLRQYITFSEDGYNWEKPQRILEDGEWLWRIREHNGSYYGLVTELGTKADGSRQHNLVLKTSNDLLKWEPLARIGSSEEALSESDITFQNDGTAWIVARSSKEPGYSYFCYSTDPYSDWNIQPLGAMIHAPIILEHNGSLYVTGRSNPSIEGISDFPSPASLGIWKLTHNKVESVLRIPAMGDCSYPGFIKDPEGRICLTYYSQHAYYMGVVDDHTLSKDPSKNPDDVYFAEIELGD